MLGEPPEIENLTGADFGDRPQDRGLAAAGQTVEKDRSGDAQISETLTDDRPKGPITTHQLPDRMPALPEELRHRCGALAAPRAADDRFEGPRGVR